MFDNYTTLGSVLLIGCLLCWQVLFFCYCSSHMDNVCVIAYLSFGRKNKRTCGLIVAAKQEVILF